jgi:pyruvate/2-oxoglutarate dehydrogenase complex dihydrolipoamide dehydrogenase (E3) component
MRYDYDRVVVGGGSGGLTAAAVAASLTRDTNRYAVLYWKPGGEKYSCPAGRMPLYGVIS